jgi:hypothetical protein
MHHPGTVKKNVDTAEYLDSSVDESNHLSLPGNIGGYPFGISAQVLDSIDSFLQFQGISGGTCDICTRSGKTESDFPPQTLAGTHHQGCFIFETEPINQ